MGLWEESNRDEWGFEERDEEMDEGVDEMLKVRTVRCGEWLQVKMPMK